MKNQYNDSEQSENASLPRNEVIKRLRERSHPVTLFGESELQSFKRLRRIEILEPEANKGFRNDFQEAMDKVDQAYLNEFLAFGAQVCIEICILSSMLVFYVMKDKINNHKSNKTKRFIYSHDIFFIFSQHFILHTSLLAG